MRKLFSALLVLTLICGFTGLALAAESEAPAVQLEDLLAPESETCLGSVDNASDSTADNQLADLEAELMQPMAGQPCNETTCAPNEFCCNFSCSICAPRGGFCIQIICE